MGVIRIYAEAKINGKIVSIKDELDDLRSEAGFRIHPDLYTYILEQMDEE